MISQSLILCTRDYLGPWTPLTPLLGTKSVNLDSAWFFTLRTLSVRVCAWTRTCPLSDTLRHVQGPLGPPLLRCQV